jgi:hypothetical protein
MGGGGNQDFKVWSGLVFFLKPDSRLESASGIFLG